MMHHDRRRRLLGRELEGRGEIDAERLTRRKELEELRMPLEVRARGIAPRGSLALAPRYPELAPNHSVHPLRGRLRGLDTETVQVVRLRELALLLQLGEAAARLIAYRDDLK